MQLFEVYRHYQTDLMRFARSLTNQKEPAEDLVQQAYLKALDHLDLFEVMHPEQIKGWFFTTIKRLYLDAYRKQRRWNFVDFEGAHMENILHEQGDGSLYDHEGALLDRLELNRGLQHLSDEHRKVLIMRYVEGLNANQIAQRTGQNPSTIRSQLMAARRQMMKLLEVTHESL